MILFMYCIYRLCPFPNQFRLRQMCQCLFSIAHFPSLIFREGKWVDDKRHWCIHIGVKWFRNRHNWFGIWHIMIFCSHIILNVGVACREKLKLKQNKNMTINQNCYQLSNLGSNCIYRILRVPPFPKKILTMELFCSAETDLFSCK